jgi:hypothetical protein
MVHLSLLGLQDAMQNALQIRLWVPPSHILLGLSTILSECTLVIPPMLMITIAATTQMPNAMVMSTLQKDIAIQWYVTRTNIPYQPLVLYISHNEYAFSLDQSEPPHENSQHDQPLGEPNDIRFPTPDLIQEEEMDDPASEDSDLDFNPSDFDEVEHRETVQVAELHAHAEALCALDQPEQPLASGADEEADDLPATASCIESIKITQEFIKEIHAATLDNGNLDEDVIYHLRNPLEEPVDISDPDIRLSLDLFLALTNASEDAYKSCRDAILRRYPDSELLSYHSVKKLIAKITRVVAVYDDMCINSCHAFMGPFSQLKTCTICGEDRYDATQLQSTGKKVARQQFCTILLGPQLQVLH